MKLNNWLFFLTVLRLQCEELLQNPSFPNSALGVSQEFCYVLRNFTISDFPKQIYVFGTYKLFSFFFYTSLSISTEIKHFSGGQNS